MLHGRTTGLAGQPAGLDHDGWSAHVDVEAAQVGVVGDHRLVHEPGAPRPVRVGLGQDRGVAEAWPVPRPGLREFRQVEVAPGPYPPVEVHGAAYAAGAWHARSSP